MLEETLKLINKNLERIADSLDAKKEPSIYESNAEITGKIADDSINQIVSAIPVQTTPIVATTVAQPTTPAVQTPIQAPAMPVVPTAPVTQGFTQDQLAVAMSNAVAAGKMQIVLNTLASLGVQALTDVKPEDYNKLASMLQAQGVEV